MRTDLTRLADELRAACVRTVLSAYEDAGISGLCAEGRIEYAVDALRQVDLERILRAHLFEDMGEPPAPDQRKT
jgi:hypothetical protein